jgi:rSAM/selenodomain-associated transferase 2
LNAAAELPGALAALSETGLVREIVVADGGSGDRTRDTGRDAGAIVVEAARGRGPQLAAGATAASGEWLLFLHVDCRLPDGWMDATARFIDEAGSAKWAGYFDLMFDDPCPAARRLERVVAWRSRLLGLPYGDQGLLISRQLYDTAGGFAAIPLMEDVEFARRLGRGRIRPIGFPITASARRYRRDGYVKRPLRNLFCLSLYFAGVPPHRIARFYG